MEKTVIQIDIPDDQFASVVDKMKHNVMLACELNSPFFADIKSVKNGGKVTVESCSLDLEPPSINLRMVANYTSIHDQKGKVTFVITEEQPIMGINFIEDGNNPENDVMAIDIITKIMGTDEPDDVAPKMRMGLDTGWNVQQPPKSIHDEMMERRDMLKKLMNDRGNGNPKKRKEKFF